MPKVRNILPKKEHEPGRAMMPFTHGMEEFFQSAFPRRWMEEFFAPYAWRRPFFAEYDEKYDVFPKVDVIDKDEALVVRADVPGIKKEDLEITISGDRLVIEAKREYEEEEKKEVISGIIERSPKTARLIVIGSNEFLTDTTIQFSASSGTSQFLNSLQLVQNAIDWSLEDRGLLSIRSRGNFSRTLFPLERKAQLIWEYGNYIAALVGLLLVFSVFRILNAQKRQYHARLVRAASAEVG